MLDKLKELSLSIWEPVGNLFSSVYDASNVWVPIIAFFVISYVVLYLLHRLLNIIVNIKLDDFKNILPLLIKGFLILLVVGLLSSLAFYMYNIYETHESKVVVKQDHSLDYLLR